MTKHVSFNNEKFYKGFHIAAKAVGGTLGPLGRNVYLADKVLPRFTNDGASIANKIILSDPEEDAGAWVIRSATARAADESGDGTTTTAVIAEALFDQIQKSSVSAVEIRRQLYESMKELRNMIADHAHPTKVKDIRHIASVSSEDETLTNLITEVFDKRGPESQITVEDSEDATSSVEIKDGYEVNVGCVSPWLLNKRVKQMAEYKNVSVLCTHKKVENITQLLPIYEKLQGKGITSLVIVCDDMDDVTLGHIVSNHQRGTFSTLVIRATGERLDDIASVVGATPISQQTGRDFADKDVLQTLGVASLVVSTVGTAASPGRSTFVGRNGKTAKERATQLEAHAATLHNDFEKQSVLKRAAKLKSGIAVIKIGAYSEQELGYLRDKADDAIKAVRSALEEGYIEGGGITLYKISQELEEKTLGDKILKAALQAPFKRIIENAGQDFAEIVRNMPKNIGYNAKNNKYEDFIKSGIIDPAKVARVAVESAISSVSEMLVTHALVVDNPENNEKQ